MVRNLNEFDASIYKEQLKIVTHTHTVHGVCIVLSSLVGGASYIYTSEVEIQ